MITLATPFTISGSLSENDTQGAAVTLDMDWMGNIGTIKFAVGSGAPASFNIGAVGAGQAVTLTVNMTTGAWQASTGQSGTFSGAGFTNFQNQFKSIRNAAEGFAAAQITTFLGSQVAWT
jgi:hypothetical protein